MAKRKVTKPATTAAPNTADEAGKDEKADKPKKVQYPGLANDAQLTEVPSDWDGSKHEPLLQKHFKSKADYLDFRANEDEKHLKKIELRIKERREEAADIRAGRSTSKDKRQTKQMVNILSTNEAIRAKLEAAGVPLDAIEAALGMTEETEEAEAETES